ncbi:MAG TPA: hypothetical protein VLL94_09160, partial [Nitrospiraceae bacterium]|nr:hypothetical protein [Nitrospiraceae bacterium]
EELEKLRLQMEEARRKGDWQKMSEIQYGKIPELESQQKNTPVKARLLRTQVGAEEIAEVVSRATGIPVSKMMQGEREKLIPLGAAGSACSGRSDGPRASDQTVR